ncbi:hypothetical protein FS749_000823 [Ceratobasidium sp. UAMH 11750]|nr:hypothetical protein FS749_000823 [Ceratobasidium sp. UAMH 11750]
MLRTVFGTLARLPPDHRPERGPEPLSRVCRVLVDAVNRVDTFADDTGTSICRLCPASCKPPPPPPEPALVHKSVVTAPVAAPAPPPCAASQRPNTATPGLARTLAHAYAQAAHPPAPAAPAPVPAPLPRKPKAPKLEVAEPVRLVARFGGRPPQDLRSGSQSELFRRVSNTLDVHPTITGISALGAHWNRKGNINASFSTDTQEAAILGLRPAIRLALSIPDSVDLSIDKTWSKLMISSAPARVKPGSPVFSQQALTDSFIRNQAIRGIVVTRQPSWVCNPGKITGSHSSFTLTFEDPDASNIARLRKTGASLYLDSR